MESMVANLMVDTGWIGMKQLRMAGSLIHRIGEVMDMGSTLVLVQTDSMDIIAIILTEGMIGDICLKSSRNPSHLHFMES